MQLLVELPEVRGGDIDDPVRVHGKDNGFFSNNRASRRQREKKLDNLVIRGRKLKPVDSAWSILKADGNIGPAIEWDRHLIMVDVVLVENVGHHAMIIKPLTKYIN